jgi:lysophospholipase L1-like esterase
MADLPEHEHPDPTSEHRSPPAAASRLPRIVRVALPVLVFVLALAVVEGGARLLGLGAADPATDPSRGFLPFRSVFVERPGPGGETRLDLVASRSAMMRRLQFNPQSVPLPKPEGEFRIVWLGGSSTYGWPYDDRLSYPRLLEIGLRASAPEVGWRVVNMGAPGYGTTRLRLIAEELPRLDPDLVILTAGNNEALEMSFARQVFGGGAVVTRALTALARRSRLVSWLVGVRTRMRPHGEESEAPPDALLRVDARQREQLVERFRSNVAAMRDLFLRSGSRVYLSTAPVNQREFPPFADDAPGGPDGPQSERLIRRYAEGTRLLDEGGAREAVEVLAEVCAEAPESARARFRYAVALESAGRLDEARQAYQAATDLDPVVLRSFSALAEATPELTASPDVSFVDLPAAMRAASAKGVPGLDLFLDNCHPNPEGAAVIALAIARAMVSDGLLAAGPDWEERFRRGVQRYLDGLVFSDRDEVAALQFLLWLYRFPAADPRRADAIQAEIERLDPRAELTSQQLRSALFR